MNSTTYANRAISPFRRFNSQRIELFHVPAGRYKMQWQKFQFPTGWNSTDCGNEAKESEIVSIPNGMEFYSFGLTIDISKIRVSIPNGMEFYCLIKRYSRRLCVFQFPTGWNSTICLNFSILSGKSFNSQRDGILRRRSLWESDRYRVSIPNGMEFY